MVHSICIDVLNILHYILNFLLLFRYLFHNGILAAHYDWFHCVVNIPEDAVRVGEPHEGEQMATLTSGK